MSKKISQLSASGTLTGTELVESVQGGINVKTTTQDIANLNTGITRESNRATSNELLFDKNIIQMETIVQTGPLILTVDEIGSLVGQESVIITKIQSNGVDTITFQSDPDPYFNNFSQGEILDAGTYKVFILRDLHGEYTMSVVKPSYEVQTLTPLTAPSDFEMVPGAGDSETQIDATWTAVPNATEIVIELSATGGSGPWTLPITLAGNATSYTRTGLTANTTYHQRLQAIGDGVTFADSVYVIDAATTSDAGDVTDPTAVSTPANTATGIVVNQVVVITWDEALRDADGVTEITSANILDYLTAVNSSAGAQSITATIDVTKKIFTITPNVVWDENEDITITLDGVEDMNGNEPAPFVFTFSTSDYTEMEGNHMSLANQIDSYLVGADKDWEAEIQLNELLLSGTRGQFQKYAAGAESYNIYLIDNDAFFKYYRRQGATLVAREITWPNAFSGFTVGKITFKYFGALDTNNGLDRAGLFIDDVEITAGKTLSVTDGAFPFDVSASSAAFMLRGPAFRQARNFIFRTDMGATTVVDIPIIRTGVDVSGNSFDGTWI